MSIAIFVQSCEDIQFDCIFCVQKILKWSTVVCCWVVAWEKKKYNVPHSLQFSWQEKSILIIIGIFTNHLLRIFFQKEVVMLWVFMSSVFDVSIPIPILPENWYKFFSKSKDWYHVVLPFTLIWLMCNRFFILLNRWAFQ